MRLRIGAQRGTWLPLVAVLAFSIAVAAVLVSYRGTLDRMGDWGYLGAFLTQLVNNVTLVFPALGQVFIVAMASTLNPWLLGILGGLGGALGELSGYLLGVGGHFALLRNAAGYQQLRSLTQRWAGGAIFVFAATPLPFDVAGIWAGSVRYPLWRFLLYTAAGKIVSTTGLALAGYYGVSWVERLFFD